MGNITGEVFLSSYASGFNAYMAFTADSITRLNNTVTFNNFGLYVIIHTPGSGVTDGFAWRVWAWVPDGNLVVNNVTIKGTSPSSLPNGYSAGTSGYYFSIGVSAGQTSVNAQGQWHEDVDYNVDMGNIGIPSAGAPTLDSHSESGISSNSATINWTSSPGANCTFSNLFIQYGTTTGYGNNTAGLGQNGSTTLSGLSPNTTYHYRVVMTNGAGIVTNSSDFTFTTIGYDTTKNIGQSADLHTGAALLATAQVLPTETLPASTSIAYAVKPDNSTGFITLTKNTDTNLTVPALGTAPVHSWKATLNGLINATPVLSGLSVQYRKAMPLSATTHRLAQSFSSGAGGSIVAVMLNLARNITDTVNYTIEIQPDSAGSPSGTPITNGSATITAITVPSWDDGRNFGWVSAVFSTPPTLTASTTYWIVVKQTTTNTGSKLLWRARGNNSYASGAAKYSTNSGTGWTSMSTDDFLFQVITSGGTFSANVVAKVKRRYL